LVSLWEGFQGNTEQVTNVTSGMRTEVPIDYPDKINPCSNKRVSVKWGPKLLGRRNSKRRFTNGCTQYPE